MEKRRAYGSEGGTIADEGVVLTTVLVEAKV